MSTSIRITRPLYWGRRRVKVVLIATPFALGATSTASGLPRVHTGPAVGAWLSQALFALVASSA
jgi:hypothetical protein